MPIEIERKYLVRNTSFKEISYKKERIMQGYLSTDPDRNIRVRLKGDKAYLTIKGRGNASGISRFEWEKEITVDDALQLIQLCDNETIIDKTRYYVKANDGLFFEVDEFHGLNDGLIVAEIELESEDDIIDKPDWLGKEVTGDTKYYNSQLSIHPYSKW